MFEMIQAEMLRWRRSWFPLISLGGAVAAPLLMLLTMALGHSSFGPERWQVSFYFQQVFSLYCLLTGGMTAALIAAQAFFSEFQGDTLKLWLTSPSSRAAIFTTKSLLSLAWSMTCTLIAWAVGELSVLVLGLNGDMEPVKWLKVLLIAGVCMSSLLPLYHLLTLVARNFFLTVGAGMAVMVAGMILVNTKYLGWHPYTAPLVLAGSLIGRGEMTGLSGTPTQFILIFAALAVVGFLSGLVYFVRSDFK